MNNSANNGPGPRPGRTTRIHRVAATLLVVAAAWLGAAGAPARAEVHAPGANPGVFSSPDAACPAGGQCFGDLAPGTTFYDFVNRIYQQDLVTGYPCGNPGELCDSENRPYYRPGTTVTRAQMAKFIDNARHLPGIHIDSVSNVQPIYARTTASGGAAILGEVSSNTLGAAAIKGVSTEFAAVGVMGMGALAVYGVSTDPNGRGVIGEAQGANAFALSGNNNTGPAVYGSTQTGYGVFGISTGAGKAGHFQGNVQVTGNLAKGGGSFKIDHPLDPQNKYLYHSFVESPDMMNVYNGNITLNVNGEATVTLPEWFETLNREFRYQLTAVGAPGPNLYVAQKVTANCFKIAGGSPGMEVSWQVTGIRHDPYAEKHRIPVEEIKPEGMRGTYLHPDAYGQPATKGENTNIGPSSPMLKP